MKKCGPTALKLETQSADHRTHVAILPCVTTYGYLWVRYTWQPGTQSNHTCNKKDCVHTLMLLSLEAMASIPFMKAVQYSEEFYLILHLTLLNQCFRQQSTSETCGVHEKSRCCRGAPQILCTNSTQFLHTHTQKPYIQALNFLLFHSPWHIFLSRAPFVCLS